MCSAALENFCSPDADALAADIPAKKNVKSSGCYEKQRPFPCHLSWLVKTEQCYRSGNSAEHQPFPPCFEGAALQHLSGLLSMPEEARTSTKRPLRWKLRKSAGLFVEACYTRTFQHTSKNSQFYSCYHSKETFKRQLQLHQGYFSLQTAVTPHHLGTAHMSFFIICHIVFLHHL